MSSLLELVADAKADVEYASNPTELENIRIKYFGRKGQFSFHMKKLRELPIEELPLAGRRINDAKEQVIHIFKRRKVELECALLCKNLADGAIDISLPGRRILDGSPHPITRTIDSIEDFFFGMGFTTVSGMEIEDVHHNFDALNIPSHHPARTEQDTFWFDKTRLLRTQTSGVQIRIMSKQPPPIRVISSGRVYRHDHDQMHTPMFHQMEGLVVDSGISFANLKSILHELLNEFFGEELDVRFRPSYFPFTEPSAELDIMDKNGDWLEVLGCGMVHPNVLKNVGIDTDVYSGFAFGIGIERLTMLRYGVTDIRAFFENDIRFLKQFK